VTPIGAYRGADEAGIEVVVLERDVSGICCIVADEHTGEAWRHGICWNWGTGNRCIVLAGASTSSVARAEGYRTALQEAGILPEAGWIVESEYGYMAGRNGGARISEVTRSPDGGGGGIMI